MQMEYSVESLVECRSNLVNLRIEARHLKASIDNTKFIVERDAIEAASGNYGKNAEERDRFLSKALLESSDYRDISLKYQDILDSIEREETQLEILRDLRRERETLQRDRMIESRQEYDQP